MSPARALASLLCVTLVACGGRAEPRDEIVFAHGAHLAEGMTCVRCHQGVERGDAAEADEDAGDEDAGAEDAGVGHAPVVLPIPEHPSSATRPLLPAEADCRSCHDDAARDTCARCHTAPQRAGRYAEREREIHFDHSVHAQPGEGRCVVCHASTGGRTEATYAPGMPSMQSCTGSCHQEAMRTLDCALCHSDLHRYRIEEVTVLDHGPGFLRRHATPAIADPALCTQCHDPTFCEDCHLSSPGMPLEVLNPDAQYRDFVHRGDFLSRHGTEADLERGTCLRCHGTPFCDGCHHASGVGGGVGPGSPHPPGWLDPSSAFSHARAARRDLISCVACHEADAETTCVPCHRVGGVAGNPHPPGFGQGTDPLAHGVCRACHAM